MNGHFFQNESTGDELRISFNRVEKQVTLEVSESGNDIAMIFDKPEELRELSHILSSLAYDLERDLNPSIDDLEGEKLVKVYSESEVENG